MKKTLAMMMALTLSLSIAAPVKASAHVEKTRDLIYALETGGMVLGKKDYGQISINKTQKTISVGAAGWVNSDAKSLINYMAGRGSKAQAKTCKKILKNWKKVKAGKAYQKELKNLLKSKNGKACQDAFLDKEIKGYFSRAKDLKVTGLSGKMMAAYISHFKGDAALKRVLKKTAKPYNAKSMYQAMKSDKGSQIGANKAQTKLAYSIIDAYTK